MGPKINRKIEKNKNFRVLTNKFEMKKKALQFMNLTFLNKYQENNYLINLHYLQFFGRRSSVSSIKNICVETGRYRGVLSFYKLSRLKLKEFGSMALLPGLRRSSW